MRQTSLVEINREYEQILHSDSSQDEKDRRLAALMTRMESEYGIPFLRSEEFERKNPAVIAMYRKLSMSRSL